MPVDDLPGDDRIDRDLVAAGYDPDAPREQYTAADLRSVYLTGWNARVEAGRLRAGWHVRRRSTKDTPPIPGQTTITP